MYSIIVLSIEVNSAASIWLRLIGPQNALKLELSTKATHPLVVITEAKTEAVPESHIKLEHAGARSRTCTSTSINKASANIRSPGQGLWPDMQKF